jgi:hypothetical protein
MSEVMRRNLVPVDFSTLCEPSARYACTLAAPGVVV